MSGFLKVSELKMKCEKCGKEKIYNDVEIDDVNYNQFVITVCDMDEKNFEGYCDCEMED